METGERPSPHVMTTVCESSTPGSTTVPLTVRSSPSLMDCALNVTPDSVGATLVTVTGTEAVAVCPSLVLTVTVIVYLLRPEGLST